MARPASRRPLHLWVAIAFCVVGGCGRSPLPPGGDDPGGSQVTPGGGAGTAPEPTQGGGAGTAPEPTPGGGAGTAPEPTPVGRPCPDGACEVLLAYVIESDAGWVAAPLDEVSFQVRYAKDNPACAGVAIGASRKLADGDRERSIFTAANERDFAAFVACLTNGENDRIEIGWQTASGAPAHWSSGFEKGLLRGRSVASAEPDLLGASIYYAALTPNLVVIRPERSGWQFNFRWTWEFFGVPGVP